MGKLAGERKRKKELARWVRLSRVSSSPSMGGVEEGRKGKGCQKEKKKKSYLDANRLQSGFSSRRNSNRSSTVHSKSVQQSFSDSGDIVVGDTKGGSGFSDVGDEPTDFVLVQSHELVHFVHGGSAWVGLDGSAEEGASEKSGEVGVEVG